MSSSPRTLRVALVCALVASCAGSEPKPDAASDAARRVPVDLSDLTVKDFSPDAARAKDGAPSAGAGEVVGTDELPENFRAILDAWHAGGFVWEIKRSEVLSDPAETDFLVSNLILLLFDEARDLRRAAEGSEGDPSKRRSLERVKGELRLCGAPAALSLAYTLGLGDDMLATLAVEVLTGMGASAAPAVVTMLDRDEAVTRYRAVCALARLPGAGDEEPDVIAALASSAHSDRSEIVRVAATRALGERGLFSQSGRAAASVDLAPWARALEACLADPAGSVRAEALAALSTLGDGSCVPAVIDFGAAAKATERTAARKTLESVTGQHFGTDFAAWKGWWKGQENEN